MTISIETEKVPLEMDDDGVLRVGGTRVTLDVVVTAFNEGATAEEISQQYPSLKLADVYFVIGFYLQRHAEIDDYLNERQKQIQTIRKQNESRFDPQGIRERLTARNIRYLPL